MRETTNPLRGLTIGISLWYTIMGDFVLNSSEGLRDVLRRSEQLRGISEGSPRKTSENSAVGLLGKIYVDSTPPQIVNGEYIKHMIKFFRGIFKTLSLFTLIAILALITILVYALSWTYVIINL